MSGPVFVTLTTSWTGSPTFAPWVATASTVAVIGTGLEHMPEASIATTSPASFIVVDP